MQNNSVDLTKVDVEALLTALRVDRIERSGDEINFSCPFPGHEAGDETPSAYMNTGQDDPDKATLYYCHGCHAKGNAITFMARHEGVTDIRAARWLREEFDADFHEPVGGTFAAEWEDHFSKVEERSSHESYMSIPDDVLERFAVDWSDVYSEHATDPTVTYLFDRGFMPQSLEQWEIGFDGNSWRFTIPVRDTDGSLVGIKGRTPRKDRKPRYKALGDRKDETGYGFPTYSPHLFLYGLHLVDDPTLILVEGELNVIAMHQMGFTNTVGLGGSNFSKRQQRLVRWHADDVIAFLDSDKAGYSALLGRGADQPGILDQLEPYIPIRIVGDHELDPADMLQKLECPKAAVEQLMEESEPSLSVTLPL